MPNPLIKKYAKQTGKSVDELEKIWDECKAIVTKSEGKEYKYFYPTVVKIFKNKLGMNENFITLHDYELCEELVNG